MTEGFVLTAFMASVFYRACGLYHVTGKNERLTLMRKLVAKKKAQYVRDAKTFMSGKNVIRIIKKDPMEDK